MRERIFLEKIRSNKIKTPLQKGFSIEQWLKDYKENLSIEDAEVFQAGLIFSIVLDEIRDELKKLYEEYNPFSSYDELIKFYFSLSNRDKNLLLTQMKEKSSSSTSSQIHTTFNNNPLKNELTANDISTMCVDGLSKALHNCILKREKSDKLKISNSPLSKIEFAKKEAYLSQIYETIEHYWYSIILNDYRFLNKKIEDDTLYIIEEPNSEYEQILLISSERRMRISTHISLISASNPNIGNLVKKSFKYIKNNRAFKVIESKDIEDEILYSYISLKSQEAYLKDYIPKEFLEKEYNGNKFSILDILKVFEQLSLLSIQYLKSQKDFDIEISDDGINKLLEFCPILKKVKITKSMVQVTGFKYKKVEKILDFLLYKGTNKNDFWCNPLYSISTSEFILLSSAIDSPILLRIIEHWLVQLNIPLDMKGIHYEKNIISEFNKTLHENKEIVNFDNAITTEIKLGSKTEEIDFLSRIGNKILIGEAKCIVVSDSPNSEYRTFETLQGASSQVNRKKKFIEENLQELFEKLKWEFDDKESYELIGFILNSNKTFVGLNINGVSIIDEKLLFNYFKSNISPLVTVEGKKHLAWFVLYNNFEEMLNNFLKYINNPPPIIIHKNFFKRDFIKTPYLKGDSCKIILSRLLKEEVDIQLILKKEYLFPLYTINDIEKYLADGYFAI